MKLRLSVLTRKWPQKLLAFAIAYGSFFILRGLISEPVTLTVPVRAVGGERIAVESVEPSTVQVTFRGSDVDIRGLDRQEVEALLQISPISSEEDGLVSCPIRRWNIRCPRGVQVVTIKPDKVQVRLDRSSTMAIPVSLPPLVGKPLKGLATVTLAESKVQVSGSRRALQMLAREGVSLQTSAIDIEGAPQSFSTRVTVLAPPNIAVQSIHPLTLSAVVTISTENIFREVSHIPVRVVQPASGPRLMATPSFVTVRLTGQGDVIERLGSEAIAVYAELDQTNTSVRVWTPGELKLERAEVIPSQVVLSPEAPHEQ